MLSTENPSPDPLQVSNLNSVVSNDKLPINSSDLDPALDHHNHHNPPPNFSIRDYVFGARSKDITKNWPFSLRTLQLSLKHGLKDPLPPFQSLDAVRNQSSESSAEPRSPEKKIVSNVAEEPLDYVLNHQKADNARLNPKAADTRVGVVCVAKSRSGVGNDIPSTSASVHQSELETLPSARPSEADQTVLEASTVQAPLSRKTETNKTLSKKCRLVVKFGAFSDRSSTEEITSNCTAVSELMASKTCPVCKVFSSSSNTTLNAHIDQCLSSNSAPKWASDSKSYRHKIKPRKIKLLADIYATAKPCTLEELDKRNGTSWALISSSPAQESDNLEISDEAGKAKVSRGCPNGAPGDVDQVYVDANGTKVRILSKLDDSPVVSKASKDIGPKKALKGGKGSKCFTTKKKSRQGKKRHKYLKLIPQSRKLLSQKAHSSQVLEEAEKLSGERIGKKDGPLIQKQSKRGQPGNLKQCVSPKSSGLVTQINKRGSKWHVMRNPPTGTNQSCVDESCARANQVQKVIRRPTANTVSPSECNHTTETTHYEERIIDKRKRLRSPFIEGRTVRNMERPSFVLKGNKDQPGKVDPSCHGGPMLRPRLTSQNSAPSFTKRKICHDATNLSDASPGFRSKTLRFSSGKRAAAYEARHNSVNEPFSLKRIRLQSLVDTDEEPDGRHFARDQDCDLMQTESHVERRNVGDSMPCSRQTRAESQMFQRDDTGVLNSSHLSSQYYGRDNHEKEDIFVGTDEDDDENADDGDDDVDDNDDDEGSDNVDDEDDDDILDGTSWPEPSWGKATSLSESLDADFNGLRNPSRTQSDPLQSGEDYDGDFCSSEALMCPSEPSLFGGQEMYSARGGKGIPIETDHIAMEFNSNDVEHKNSIHEVDPIPIPGPPGSFLPSPRDMGSDDFPGNSSLTTSRVQSSHDQLDFTDRNSSESPISAASTISNPTAGKSNHIKYDEHQSTSGVGSIQEKVTSGLDYNIVSAVISAGSSRETSSEPDVSLNTEKFGADKFFAKRKPFGFKNDNQPCCCQRREKSSQGFTLNYQESQLLRRRMTSSITVPATGIQMGFSPNSKVNNLDKGSDAVARSNCTVFGPEKVPAPVLKPFGEPPFPEKALDLERKSTSHIDCVSPNPSPSNPVLRLMGKNLMVVNKGEDASGEHGQSELNYQSNPKTPQFTAAPSVSACDDAHSFHDMASCRSFIFGREPCDATGPFDVRNRFGNKTNSTIHQNPSQFPAGTFPSQHIGSPFAASMDGQTFVDDFSQWSTGSTRQRNKSGANSNTSNNKTFLHDDVPDGGAAIYSQGLRRTPLSSFSGTIPMDQSLCSSKHRSSFNSFQQYESAVHPTLQNDGFPAIPSRQANATPFRWGCTTQEGSGPMHGGSHMAASTSPGHISPAVYHPSRQS